jgi:hypothetical protein
MSNLDNALRELREKRTRAQVEIEKLDQLISGIESLNGAGAAVADDTVQPKRIISASSRRKMALAQRARWASLRKTSQPIAVVAKSAGSTPVKRIMSVSARRKIAAAQKARWASLRKNSQPITVVAKTAGSAPAKRKISAAGRKRIAEAARARWAAFRTAKKKAA